MQRTKSKILSILLSLVMLLSLLPTTALAAGSCPAAEAVLVDGGKYFDRPGKLYYKNDDTADNFTGTPTDYNAAYDPDTGILTLQNYNGGSIVAGGATTANITIKLLGNNTVTGSVSSDMGGDITITSDSSSTLSITNTLSGSNNATGIEAGFGASYQTGNVTIEGKAKVIISVTNNKSDIDYANAYGIFAKENITISGDASVDITCATPNNTTGGGNCNGLRADKDVTIDTNGTIKIDVTNAGKDENSGYSFGVYPMENANLTKVGNMEVEWKKVANNSKNSGGAFTKGATFSDTDHAINVDETNCYASYRKGTPYTVTVENGTLTGTGVKHANGSGNFLEHDTVKITPAPKAGKSGESIPFEKWTSSDVAFDKSATTENNSFTVPGKNVTVTAKHSPFVGAPTFTPIGTTSTEGTLTFTTKVTLGDGNESFALVKEAEVDDTNKYNSINPSTTSPSSPYEYSSTVNYNNVPEGNYYVAEKLNGAWYLSEKFPVSYTAAPTPTANISLDKTGTVDFGSMEESYTAAPAEATVAITNSGTAATGVLTIALEGTSATNFTLSKTSITDIAASGTDTFTVQPKTGLSAGIYTATVKVSGTGVTEQSFDVKFTVTAPLTAIAVPTPNSVTYDGTKQTGVNAGMGYTLGGDYEATDVGAADYVATATLDTGYKWNDGSTDPVTITWNIGKRDPKIEDFEITLPTDLTKNYTGSPITVAAPTLKSGRTGAGTITVKYADSATVPTNAGSYTVTFDVAAGTNYNAATGLSIGTLTIKKVAYTTGTKTASATVRSGQTTANATLALPALPTGASYATSGTVGGTGSALISAHSIADTTLTYSTTSQSDDTTATITIPVTGATNYNDYNVVVTVTAKDKENAGVTISGVPTEAKTYGDADLTLTGAVTAAGTGTGNWIWEASDPTVLQVTGTGNTAKVKLLKAGSATVTAKYESETHIGEATASVTVGKKDVTITGLSASSKEYDGNTTATVSGTAVVSGKVGSDDVTVTAGSATFADKNVGSGKTVTFTGYTLGGAKAGNYNLTDQPASVTANITAKPVTVTVTATDRDYVSGNRNVVLVAGSVTGAVVGDTVNVDVSGATGTMENEDAGTGKAVTVTGVALSGSDAGNYRLTGQPTGITVNITKATYGAGPALSQKVRATGEAQNIEVDVSTHFGAIKGAAVSTAAVGTDTNNIINSVTTDGNKVKFSVANTAVAGNTATINITISCTNFQDITSVLTVEMIDKEVAGVTISGVPTEAKTYGDADFVLTATAAIPGENGVWTWESSNTSILTVTGNGNRATVKIVGTGIGTTIKATYVSDTSAGERNTAAIRVVPATITVAAKNQSIYVNGTAPNLTSPVKDTHYTVTGLAAGDTLGGTITMKYQKDGVDATPDATKTGTYDIVISGATAPAGGNYNDVVFAKGTLTISNKPSSGGGSSSGSSGSTITVPVSDPKNQIKVTASVSGTTATVQKIDLSKIDQAQGVTIDFTGLGKTIESAKLPTSAIKEIGATEGGTLTVKLTAGNVTFDTAALKAVADQAGNQITLTLTPVKTSALNASQKKAVGDAPVFDLRLLGGSKAITNFKGGNVTVTLPHTLSKGQEPAGVVVYYLSNDGNPEACKTTYDTKNKLVTFTTTHFSLYFVGYEQPAAEWKNPFTDVAEGAWYFDSVKYVHSEGMMVGTSATKFSPDATTTRGMVVTILYRLEGEPAVSGKSTFADVVGTAWYANAVEWAAKNKIVDGYGNGKFGPEDVITREQMAVILYRYAAFKGLDMTKTADLSKFTDSGKISSWAKPALSWANAERLISGKGSGILDPLGSATRAEAAAILYRFCENIVK